MPKMKKVLELEKGDKFINPRTGLEETIKWIGHVFQGSHLIDTGVPLYELPGDTLVEMKG